DRPRRRVDEDAVVAQPHAVLDDRVVPAGGPGQSPGLRVHAHLAGPPAVVVDAVVGGVGVAAGGGLHGAHHLAVAGDGDGVGGVVVGRDHRVAGAEDGLTPSGPHGDGGASGPEFVWSPAQFHVADPVELAVDGGCGADPHRRLGAGAV